jgi:hypothetical protein
MKRRAFLGVAAQAGLTAAVASTWPQFLRVAFADESAEKKAAADRDALAERRARLAVLSDGYRRAQHAGKPLLCIIVPDDNSLKWQRGSDFGRWLNYGTVEDLYALSLCEVICTRLDDLQTLVPTVGIGDPLMVLVETDRVPATVRRLEANLAEPHTDEKEGYPRSVKEWQERTRREDQQLDLRSAMLGKLVRDAVAGNPALLAQRAAQTRGVLSAAELAAVEPIAARLVGEPKLEVAAADRAAALLALAVAKAASPVRTAGHRLLEQAVEARLRRQRLPGSHWARHAGCGTTIEGAEDRGPYVACGMGHVPEKSQRFLYFFALPKRIDL